MAELTAAHTQILVPTIPALTANEDPSGKCDDWNQQFAQKAVDAGLDAALIGEAKLNRLDKQNTIIGNHAIAVGYSSEHQLWFAGDLSAGQIQGHEGPFYRQAPTLSEL